MSTKHAILGMMSWGPQSGYGIKSEFEKGGVGFVWRLGFGTIYPRLEALLADGLIRTVEVQTEGRERVVYELTAKGWDELDRWAQTEPGFPVPLEDELLLRMLFWGTACPDDRATLIQHLKRRREMSMQILQLVESGEATATDEYQGLIERYARYRLEAEARWADEAIAQLEGPPQPPRKDPNGIFRTARERKAAAFREADR